MRISDWSSDVCSSDLSVAPRLHQYRAGGPAARPARTAPAAETGNAYSPAPAYRRRRPAAAPHTATGARAVAYLRADRKSVVSGKSVSVSVDLGGRRIMNKQT